MKNIPRNFASAISEIIAAARAGANAQLDTALAYAKAGLPVFPCGADERPLTPRGVEDATTDEAQIREWWTRWPDAGVAIPTGARSGLIVLEISPDLGGTESLAALERKYGKLPQTLEARSPCGHRLLFFRTPEEER